VTFGNAEAGFSLEWDQGERRVNIRGWGFWGPEVATTFASKVLDSFRSLRPVRQLAMDFAALKPQRDEGQEAIGSVLTGAVKLGVKRVIVATSSALTKLQLLRLARESTSAGTIEFVSTLSDSARETDTPNQER
jgi:hypothetical protein